MRLLATHDRFGNITGLVTCPMNSPSASVVPEIGQFVTEVEVPEGTLDSSGYADSLSATPNPESERWLAEVLEQFRIEVKSEGKLVKKTR